MLIHLVHFFYLCSHGHTIWSCSIVLWAPQTTLSQTDLMNCLNRISTEEGEEGVADKELVKKIWVAYPAIFDEIMDL